MCGNGGTRGAMLWHMNDTIPAPTTEPVEREPLHVEALELYDTVARGTNAALKPSRVPS